MRVEKILLLFIAVVIGLCVAGVGFYFYESSKALPPSKLKTINLIPSVTPSAVSLLIDNPRDESTVGNRIITINGRTDPNATVIISSPSTDQVVSPVSTGAFSTSLTIDPGENLIRIVAIMPNGEDSEKDITITYTTENF